MALDALLPFSAAGDYGPDAGVTDESVEPPIAADFRREAPNLLKVGEVGRGTNRVGHCRYVHEPRRAEHLGDAHSQIKDTRTAVSAYIMDQDRLQAFTKVGSRVRILVRHR